MKKILIGGFAVLGMLVFACTNSNETPTANTAEETSRFTNVAVENFVMNYYQTTFQFGESV